MREKPLPVHNPALAVSEMRKDSLCLHHPANALPEMRQDSVRVPTPPTDATVELSFAAHKDKVYAAWNAIANLADMAGKVAVTVKAENPAGFDKSKLQNGVLEPLREADLID